MRSCPSIAAACWLLVGCATPEFDSPRDRLPFHVAVLPATVAVADGFGDLVSGAVDPEPADLAISFESERVTAELVDAMRGSFARVTPLTVAAAEGVPLSEALLQAARGCDADLVLGATLTYSPSIRTGLNDRFWPNLLLFALGGPATWFVSDRSYYYRANLAMEVFELSAASSADVRALDATSRIAQMDRESREASLSFIDRAAGVGAYFLGVLVPAGFVATESETVTTELPGVITEQLCAAMVRAVHERSRDLLRWDRVDFTPSDVRYVIIEGQRSLVGEITLELGDVSELGDLRYRVDGGDPQVAQWEEVRLVAPGETRPGLKRYAFRIPASEVRETVQIEVHQLDRFSSMRTFTYAVDAEEQS